jgi:hypothetical protein
LKVHLYLVFSIYTLEFKGEKAISNEKLIKILTSKRKTELRTAHNTVIKKLKKKERLTGDEFWRVYESIRQEGPTVKYSNPDGWTNYREEIQRP